MRGRSFRRCCSCVSLYLCSFGLSSSISEDNEHSKHDGHSDSQADHLSNDDRAFRAVDVVEIAHQAPSSALNSARVMRRLSSWVCVASSLSCSCFSRLISFPILRSTLRPSLIIISRSILSRSWATVMIGRGPRRLPLVLVAVLFVPLLLLLLMRSLYQVRLRRQPL